MGYLQNVYDKARRCRVQALSISRKVDGKGSARRERNHVCTAVQERVHSAAVATHPGDGSRLGQPPTDRQTRTAENTDIVQPSTAAIMRPARPTGSSCTKKNGRTWSSFTACSTASP